MPFKSKAQQALFFAAAEGRSDKIKPGVAQKFIADSKGEPSPRLLKAKRKKKK